MYMDVLSSFLNQLCKSSEDRNTLKINACICTHHFLKKGYLDGVITSRSRLDPFALYSKKEKNSGYKNIK